MPAIRYRNSENATWAPERVNDVEDILDPIARCASAEEISRPMQRPEAQPGSPPDHTSSDVIAVARSYEDLVDACRTRRHELKLSQLVVDDLAGLQSGYVGKLECGDKRMGPMSMPCLLQALGLQLVVVRTIPHHERNTNRAA